jgi:hypothetical protein
MPKVIQVDMAPLCLFGDTKASRLSGLFCAMALSGPSSARGGTGAAVTFGRRFGRGSLRQLFLSVALPGEPACQPPTSRPEHWNSLQPLKSCAVVCLPLRTSAPASGKQRHPQRRRLSQTSTDRFPLACVTPAPRALEPFLFSSRLGTWKSTIQRHPKKRRVHLWPVLESYNTGCLVAGA